MKKSTIIIFFVLAMLQTQAQDYLISFAGSGVSTTVDSVQVRNLTQNTSLTLNGTDVLHLMGIVGIDLASEKSNGDLRIYPNPMDEQSFVEFETASSGIATIELSDIAGKQVAQTQNMLTNGRHTFVVSGLISGIYILFIKSAAYVYSGKIVCTRSIAGNGNISYVSTKLKSTVPGNLKSLQSEVQMQYNNGDQLLFKCHSGIYSTIIPLIPVQSQTVTANFIICTDADGNNYATVTIGSQTLMAAGSQTWMAENMNVGIHIDGVQDQTNNIIIEKYCYNDDENNCNIYGGLYQWNEMMQYVTTPGAKGICPTGWHLPTDAEWTTLTTILGGESAAGGKMKSTGTIDEGTGLWYSPNEGATNESGFSAVPAGYRSYTGAFEYIDYRSHWWSSSEQNPPYYYVRYLFHIFSFVYRSQVYGNHGFSVRCLRDFNDN